MDPKSRYAQVSQAVVEKILSDGSARTVSFLCRRFIPREISGTVLAEHQVTSGERPDAVAAKYFGDPEQYWRLCDSASVRHPEELTQVPGSVVRVVLPGSGSPE